jgi:hypothetical protein
MDTNQIQAIIFDTDDWNQQSAGYWLDEHNIFPIESKLTEDKIEYKIKNKSNFRTVKTIKSTNYGVTYRVGIY